MSESCGLRRLGGGRTRARTWDPMIKSHLLYQLSYAPGTGRESLRNSGSFSKATSRCPASQRGFPGGRVRQPNRKKPPDFGRLFDGFSKGGWPRSEPLGAASVTAILAAARVTIPVAVAIHVVLAVSPAAAETVLHMGQDPEPALLAVVQGLVERIGGIGDLLQRRRRCRHVVGALAQSRHRIVRLLRIRGLVRLRGHSRIGAVDPHLCEIPHRGLDRRPQLFLIG